MAAIRPRRMKKPRPSRDGGPGVAMLGGMEMAEWTAKHCEGLVYKVLDEEDHLVAWTNGWHSSLIAMAPRMKAVLCGFMNDHHFASVMGGDSKCECELCVEGRAILSEIAPADPIG
jgi:hypothetical protein